MLFRETNTKCMCLVACKFLANAGTPAALRKSNHTTSHCVAPKHHQCRSLSFLRLFKKKKLVNKIDGRIICPNETEIELSRERFWKLRYQNVNRVKIQALLNLKNQDVFAFGRNFWSFFTFLFLFDMQTF